MNLLTNLKTKHLDIQAMHIKPEHRPTNANAHTHTHTQTNTRTHTRTQTYTHTCTHTHSRTETHTHKIYTHTHRHARTHTHTHTHAYVFDSYLCVMWHALWVQSDGAWLGSTSVLLQPGVIAGHQNPYRLWGDKWWLTRVWHSRPYKAWIAT